ncbi:bifunctional serine/threonine-protein kinase/formylglycine-generating enzyme family protein [Polyangium sp. 15x6]|uniref:bifunctional serine/threonine-protein kinase/formylglycine-generating enzyme family protein n=1 Tax=Polyangium sp. 15x6 TaxID=3042687 RepID=UPI00249B3768|nr:bifunctional serine/threonine-protein kinase/formylglycine-generating enzyme family protein [Polyangium sp. 15x6]MDI3284394.1 bifunctional serine/threonine-protein kinase/formylglycine-generating enzyme family protein [Polyangium sp. 15x6]
MASAALADPFAWVGQTIDGKFRVEAVVGEGGFGIVYRALHLGLGEPVAVKCLKIPPTLAPDERERFQQSFLEEGRLLRKLSRATPSVVQALDVGAAVAPSGVWAPYLVLEWLHGETLEAFLARRNDEKKGGMPLADAAALLEPAALALAAAHDEGIAHRDIKPANLFLTDAGIVGGATPHTPAGVHTMKVLDFGIAKVIADNASITRAMEQTGHAPSIFTPFYGAPEQFNRRFGATGPWTDVYALALVLVELCSGKSALVGDDVTQLYIATTDVSLRPTPRTHGVRTSHAVEAVFQKALAIEPRGRYTSARLFWDALREALPSPIEADAPGTTVVREVSHDSLTPSPQITEARTSKPASSRRSLFAAIGAFTFVAAALAASVVIKNRGEIEPMPTVSRMGPEFGHVELPSPTAEMILVPAGSFTMGHAKEGKTERPAHAVTISKPFYLDRTEVTAEEYARCVAAEKCTRSGVHGPGVDEAEATKFATFCTEPDPAKARHPINCIDQGQAAKLCAFLGKRLPTEAEWEYAARGKDERLYPWGEEHATCTLGNFSRAAGQCPGRAKGTMPVGSFPDHASPFGALDMAGNVWEWVADAFDPGAYTKAERKDPLVAAGAKGVIRGGSWDFASSAAKSTTRYAFDRATGHVSTGVRCAKTAD